MNQFTAFHINPSGVHCVHRTVWRHKQSKLTCTQNIPIYFDIRQKLNYGKYVIDETIFSQMISSALSFILYQNKLMCKR